MIERPTRKHYTETGGSTASLFGLAPQGVCLAIDARARCGALLPHHFTLTRTRQAGWRRYLSVALSVASPRLDVIQPAARESSDFPPSRQGGTAILRSTPPSHSTAERHTKLREMVQLCSQGRPAGRPILFRECGVQETEVRERSGAKGEETGRDGVSVGPRAAPTRLPGCFTQLITYVKPLLQKYLLSLSACRHHKTLRFFSSEKYIAQSSAIPSAV